MFQASKGAASSRHSSTALSTTTSTHPPPPAPPQQQHQQCWDDFLPPGLAPASPSSPLPLFSPSQESQKENVLHSIFSPSFLFQQHRQHTTPTGGGAMKKMGRHHVNGSKVTGTTASDQTATTPPHSHYQDLHQNNNQVDWRRQQRPTSSLSIPRSLYVKANNGAHLVSPLEISYSPGEHMKSRSSLGRFHTGEDCEYGIYSSHDGDNEDHDDDNEDDFYSAITASIAAASAVASVSSWKTYSLEHITSCRDAQELQQIMQQLAAESSTTPCPSLQRAAQERFHHLTIMTGGGAPRNDAHTSLTVVVPPPPPPPPQNTEPAMAAPVSVEVHSINNSNPSPSAQTTTSMSLVYSEDGSQFPFEQQQLLDTTTRGHDHKNQKSNKPTPSLRSSSSKAKVQSMREQHELQAQVARLKDTIVELDQRHAQEQADFLKRLQDLRIAESRTGEKIQQLQHDLSSSQLSNKELLESLDEMQEDVQTLRFQYQAEQTARTKQAQQHHQVEARLTVRIQQLVQQLEEQQKKLAAAAAAKTMENVTIDPVVQQKVDQLQVEVRSLQYQLESVRKERNAMLRAMIDATGQSVHNIKQMAGHDRRCLIADFAKRSAACKSAFDAMAKALTLSEMERRQSIDCQRKMEGQLKEMVQANARLEENSFQQIHQLSQELAASRAQVDELLHSVHAQQQKEYHEREVQYQRTIRNLKKQICSQPSMVPTRDYKSAVAETVRLTHMVDNLEQQLLHQQDYYRHEQQKLQRSQQQQQERKSWQGQQPDLGRVDSQCSSKENRQPLRPLVIVTTENRAPIRIAMNTEKNAKRVSIRSPPPRGETKAKDGAALSPPPSSGKQKSKRRQDVGRQHLSRRALQARLQEIRTPSVATSAAH